MEIITFPGEKMKILRIIFCVLSCLSLAAVVPVGALCGLGYIAIPVVACALFAFLMFFVKQKSEPAPKKEADFMNTDKENAAIKREQNKDNM